MRLNVKAAAANLALVVASLVLGYLAMEAAFFRLILPNTQLSMQPYLPETVSMLVQGTKAGDVPRDYIAILGDSYAEGVGDSLLASGNNRARAIHAAHVIRELTGRDVVSFGRGGSSNAEGLVRQPARIMGGRRCYFFPKIEEPKQIFAYFYEGNDIQDNMWFMSRVASLYGRRDAAAIDSYLSEQYGTFALWRCHLYLWDTAYRMVRFLYRYRYLGRNLIAAGHAAGGNLLRIDGKTYDAPAPLEGPAIEVGAEGLQAGLEVFDRSLAWLRRRFSQIPIAVVYLPAPLSTYSLAGTSYIFAHEPRESLQIGTAWAAEIAARSEEICNLIRASALRHRAGFLDARPSLRAAAATQLIHGPVDWRHFNEQGYRALGRFMARSLEADHVDVCN